MENDGFSKSPGDVTESNAGAIYIRDNSDSGSFGESSAEVGSNDSPENDIQEDYLDNAGVDSSGKEDISDGNTEDMSDNATEDSPEGSIEESVPEETTESDIGEAAEPETEGATEPETEETTESDIGDSPVSGNTENSDKDINGAVDVTEIIREVFAEVQTQEADTEPETLSADLSLQVGTLIDQQKYGNYMVSLIFFSLWMFWLCSSAKKIVKGMTANGKSN